MNTQLFWICILSGGGEIWLQHFFVKTERERLSVQSDWRGVQPAASVGEGGSLEAMKWRKKAFPESRCLWVLCFASVQPGRGKQFSPDYICWCVVGEQHKTLELNASTTTLDLKPVLSSKWIQFWITFANGERKPPCARNNKPLKRTKSALPVGQMLLKIWTNIKIPTVVSDGVVWDSNKDLLASSSSISRGP